MKSQLDSSIDKSMAENSEKVLTDIRNSVETARMSIFDILNTYVKGTSDILIQINALCKACEHSESAINSLVSFRILEFIGHKVTNEKTVESMDNDSLVSNYPVLRDWEHQSLTYKYRITLSEKDRTKAESATQMKIISK